MRIFVFWFFEFKKNKDRVESRKFNKTITNASINKIETISNQRDILEVHRQMFALSARNYPVFPYTPVCENKL